MSDFNHQRLQIAMARRMEQPRSFCRKVDVKGLTFIYYFNGWRVPPRKIVEKMAEALAWPVEFFYGEDMEAPDARYVSFRNVTGC